MASRGAASSPADWDAFASDLGAVYHTREARVLGRRSRDFYWFSPVLKETLAGMRADIVVEPSTEAEVIHVLRTSVKHGVPVTVRGAGTGNYGQAMPLYGGVVLDTRRLVAVNELADGVIRCEPGLKLVDVEHAALKQGWELRLFPSTKRTATIGGFIAGGSSGVGAIQHGYLSDPGNVRSLRVVSMEPEPAVVELRGPDAGKAAHAYGTNGVITELELALAPAVTWVDVIVACDGLERALRFAEALADADVVTKEIGVVAASIPRYFPNVDVPAGNDACLLMVAEPSMESLRALVDSMGGEVCYTKRDPGSGRTRPLYEYTWNHTTLHAINADPSITYLQSLFPPDEGIEPILAMHRHFGDEVPMHVEAVRWHGQVAYAGLQLVRYTSRERLYEVIRYHEEHGITVFDPHTHVLEDGGMKTVDPQQLAFKRQVDPMGLMNPGKMRGWWEDQAVPGRDVAIFR